jgi:hypothetical protein
VPFAPRSALQLIDEICSTANQPMFSSAVTPPGAATRPLNNCGPLVIPEPQK